MEQQQQQQLQKPKNNKYIWISLHIIVAFQSLYLEARRQTIKQKEQQQKQKYY